MNMRKQHIPDLDFGNFALGSIKALFDSNKIHINKEYQRGDVWKGNQKIELIKSIFNCYSIGVLVLYINENGVYEILDGQQRLLTLNKYLNDKIDFSQSDIKKYSDLNEDELHFLNGYSVFYLKLKSHNLETKEEDIVQTFLRLQEGTPLNKAEKLNAYRGKFKDAFRDIKEQHPLFKMMGEDLRFRLRQLSAELLLLELEGDFNNLIFPGLDLPKFKEVIKKYELNISDKKISFHKGNLDLLHQSLNILLTAITPRDLIPIYLLISYLRRNKADNTNLKSELSLFVEEMLKNLNSFSVYDTKPPSGMTEKRFKEFIKYKTEARKATSPDSIKFRLDFYIKEFKAQQPFLNKDQTRLHDRDQKRILYFRQKGICTECNKIIDFRIDGSSHHKIAHKDGGQTDDLTNAVLLHIKCHIKLETRINKEKGMLFK
jgi:hypothetical protein